MLRTAILFPVMFLLLDGLAFSSGEGRTTFELQLDPYYTAFGAYTSLTGKKMEHLSGKSEVQIYRYLLKKFYLPRTLVLEASFNPLPYLGTFIRRNYSSFYESMSVSESLNLVRTATAGFEEPWAFSIFFGNVVSFDSIKKSYQGKQKGYAGFLIDMGDYHIKDNKLCYDKWIQTELKLKGEQILEEKSLIWSFRIGAKFHRKKWIKDSLFLGFRRSRTDFKRAKSFWLNNSGFEYISSFSQDKLEPIRHYFLVQKKFPSKNKRRAFSLAVGFVWNLNKKYSGHDTPESASNFQFIIKPNIEF